MNLQELPASGDSVTAANENSLLLDWSTVYGKDPDTTTGLTWGYHGTPADSAQEGRWGGFEVAAGTLTLTGGSPPTVNYIVVARSTGAISVSTSSTNWDNTTDYAHVYKVTCDAAGVISGGIEDHRAGPNGVIGGADGADGTDGAGTITISDETGSPAVTISTIDTIGFAGSCTVTDNADGSVTVNVTAGGGGGSGALVQSVRTTLTTAGTVNVAIPLDDTKPDQSASEGTEIMTRAITPTSATNELEIDIDIQASPAAVKTIIVALFQDSTALALASATQVVSTATGNGHVRFSHRMTAGTTSATTFKVRIGCEDTTVLTYNGFSGARKLGGSQSCSITVREIVP